MKSVDIYIRYSNDNVVLDKVAALSIEGNLVYNDEGDTFRAHAKSLVKFSLITIASPLIALARLVRAAAFAFTGDFDRAGREFVGALTVKFVASACVAGTLASCFISLLELKTISLHVVMKRVYANFEAWINHIDLQDQNLVSYSQRVSRPYDFIGENSLHNHVWTTAPCMQPILENGYSARGGLYDVNRMRKIFPLIYIQDVHREGHKVVLQSRYENGFEHIQLCNGACEHARSSSDFCCCLRVETAYDRVLCCEIGQGNCTSVANHEDTCGFVFCGAGCVGVCCCTERNNLVAVNTFLL